jgi:transposase
MENALQLQAQNRLLQQRLQQREQELEERQRQLERSLTALSQRDQQLTELKDELRAKTTELDEKTRLIAALEARIRWLTKQYFATGKSESIDKAQLLLELGEAQAQLTQLQSEPEVITVQRHKPQPRVHQNAAEHFADLPVEQTVVITPEEVKAEPELYECIGEEKTFEVDVVPPRLFKREIIRRKYRHKLNRQLPPVLAPAPARVVEGGYASAGLVSYIVLSKYLDHLPLYRLEKMSQRWGARLARQTMVDWVEVAAIWLKWIYDRMRKDLIEGPYLQADETPVRYLDPDAKQGKASRGNLWVMGRPNGPVVFDWKCSREHAHALEMMDGFTGVLQADGYQAYDKLAQRSKTLVRVGCMAHVRRKWFESLQSSPRESALALKIFARIYQREALYREQRLDAPTRGERRQKELTILFRRLHRLALIVAQRSLPKSEIGKAASYTLAQWPSIEALLNTGIAELDNNLIENAIRPSAIGKKNWLFIGSPGAGGRSAIIYSIVVTCQRYGVDPHAYLRDVLSRLPSMSNQDDISALMPQSWQPARN